MGLVTRLPRPGALLALRRVSRERAWPKGLRWGIDENYMAGNAYRSAVRRRYRHFPLAGGLVNFRHVAQVQRRCSVFDAWADEPYSAAVRRRYGR